MKKAERSYKTAAECNESDSGNVREKAPAFLDSTNAMGESRAFTAVHQTVKPRCTPLGRETIPFALLMILLLLTWI